MVHLSNLIPIGLLVLAAATGSAPAVATLPVESPESHECPAGAAQCGAAMAPEADPSLSFIQRVAHIYRAAPVMRRPSVGKQRALAHFMRWSKGWVRHHLEAVLRGEEPEVGRSAVRAANYSLLEAQRKNHHEAALHRARRQARRETALLGEQEEEEGEAEKLALDAGTVRHLVDHSTALLDGQRKKSCPEFSAGVVWSLHDASVDSKGVRHVLLRTARGLQYLAESRGHLLAADPPACPRFPAALLEQEAKNSAPHGPEPLEDADDAPESLALDDQLVQDCVSLIKKVASEECQKTYDVKVETASLSIVDGLDVSLFAELSSQLHKVECLFELPAAATASDAKLLQAGSRGTGAQGANHTHVEDPTETMLGEVRMEGDFCAADQASSLSETKAKAIALKRQYRSGELSMYKGFEHLNAALPYLSLPFLPWGGLPYSYSVPEQFPECFPNDGREVTRNQGLCSGCWAFAAATTTMTNICTAPQDPGRPESLYSPSDRYEVSVQQIMSCNYWKEGCNYGTVDAADDAMGYYGIAKEFDFPYRCGYHFMGDHHFTSTGVCGKWPWGPNGCPGSKYKVPEWKYTGFFKVLGEQEMMQALAQLGKAVYIGFKVYGNFYAYPNSDCGVKHNVLYKKCTDLYGSDSAGHAMVVLAYGRAGPKRNSINYWTLQNSWGPDWGFNGRLNVLRGKNFCDVEREAFVPLVDVETKTWGGWR